jgi:hypothetical protein
MYDRSKIILGIVIFLGVIAFPVYYNNVLGQSKDSKGESNVLKGKKNVDALHFHIGVEKEQRTLKDMRANHMKILDNWRNAVVRDGIRKPGMSLQNGCLICHAKEKKNVIEFGDKEATACEDCHVKTGVQLYCWECHFDPKEAK